MYPRPNKPYRPPPKRGRPRARVAVCVLAMAMLAGCEAPVPSAPVMLPVLERPVAALDARRPPAPVLMPAAALVHRGGIPGVFVLQQASAFPPPALGADGKPLPRARFRMVKTGKTVQRRIEVLSGLAGDETVVLGELAGVRDGSPIAVTR